MQTKKKKKKKKKNLRFLAQPEIEIFHEFIIQTNSLIHNSNSRKRNQQGGEEGWEVGKKYEIAILKAASLNR